MFALRLTIFWRPLNGLVNNQTLDSLILVVCIVAVTLFAQSNDTTFDQFIVIFIYLVSCYIVFFCASLVTRYIEFQMLMLIADGCGWCALKTWMFVLTQLINGL